MTAGYPLAQLLSARRFREDEAARAVRAADDALAAARDLEREAMGKWHRYREWRPGEEERLFEAIRGKDIPRSGLDSHREDIQALRDAELQLEEDWRTAAKSAEEAEKEVEKARQRQLAAVRDRQKIEQHRDRWKIEESARQTAREEAELEDFPFRTPLVDEAAPEEEGC